VADLVDRGHEVTVLTGQPNYPEGDIYPAFRDAPEDFAEFAGAKVLRVPICPRGKGSLQLALNYLSFVLSGTLIGTWRLRHRPFDAIFVFQTSPITAALPAIWFRRLKRAPMLMWVLDLWPESLSAVGAVRSPWLLGIVGRLVSFIYKRCDRILVQSKGFVQSVRAYSPDTSKVRYFPSWAESTFARSLDAVAPAPELRPFSETFNVLFAGNIGVAQDFPAILDAAEALRDRSDIRWLIVGDGRSADDLRTKIDERGLGQCVVLLGRHPLDRMPSFMRGAQALLVSLKRDPIFSLTIPGKIQAYLAIGLPIIGMLDGEGARVIDEAGAGFTCAAGDGASLARCVAKLAELSEAERKSMGEKGKKYNSSHFDRAALISSLVGWMEELRPKR